MNFTDPHNTPGTGGGWPREGNGPPPQHVRTIGEAAQRLQTVSEKLRQFLTQKLSQLETASRQCEHMLAERNALLQQREQWQREKAEWEQHRQSLLEEIRGEQDRLIDAWNRLEDEQRQLLIQQETLGVQQHAGTTAAPKELPAASDLPSESYFAPGDSPAAKGANQAVFKQQTFQSATASVALSRESALEQFQRLKREVRNHVKRIQERSCGNGNH